MERLAGLADTVMAAGGGALDDALAIGRDMLRIPVAVFFAVAERAGALVLAGWRVVWPLALALAAAGLRALRFAQREATPARAVAAVALAAAALLAAAQFAELRAVSVGVGQYGGVEGVAPAPQVDELRIGSTHLWLGLPLALAAAALTVLAVRRRPQAARLLAVIGVAVLVLSLAVDLPKGLDEGNAAVAYEDARAELLGGFWVQLAAGGVLTVAGPLLAGYLRAARERERRTHAPSGGARPGARGRVPRSGGSPMLPPAPGAGS